MKRLTLYLFRHLAVATLFVTAGLTLVIWLTQSLRLLEIVVDGGAPIYLFLQLMLVTLPTFLSIVLPIGLLAAVLFTYNRLTMDSELVVMRAVGLGPWGLAKPAVLLGLIVMGICYGLTLFLGPASYGELARLEGMAKSQFSTVFLREGVFNEAGDGLTVYVRRRMPDGELQGLLIHDTRVEGKPVTINAERGQTVEGGAGARVVVFDGNRQEMDLETGRMSQLFFDRYAVDFRVFERQLSDRLPDARERSTSELIHAEEIPELAPFKARLTVELHQRYTSPIFALGFTLMGVAILLVGEFNRRGQGRRIIAAVASVLVLQSAALGITNLSVNNNAFIPLLYVVVAIPVLVGAFLMLRQGIRGKRMGRLRPVAG
jgi:lipopolysaccharide export system permease protein